MLKLQIVVEIGRAAENHPIQRTLDLLRGSLLAAVERIVGDRTRLDHHARAALQLGRRRSQPRRVQVTARKGGHSGQVVDSRNIHSPVARHDVTVKRHVGHHALLEQQMSAREKLLRMAIVAYLLPRIDAIAGILIRLSHQRRLVGEGRGEQFAQRLVERGGIAAVRRLDKTPRHVLEQQTRIARGVSSAPVGPGLIALVQRRAVDLGHRPAALGRKPAQAAVADKSRQIERAVVVETALGHRQRPYESFRPERSYRGTAGPRLPTRDVLRAHRYGPCPTDRNARRRATDRALASWRHARSG